jgi:hypothetical protein
MDQENLTSSDRTSKETLYLNTHIRNQNSSFLRNDWKGLEDDWRPILSLSVWTWRFIKMKKILLFCILPSYSSGDHHTACLINVVPKNEKAYWNIRTPMHIDQRPQHLVYQTPFLSLLSSLSLWIADRHTGTQTHPYQTVLHASLVSRL